VMPIFDADLIGLAHYGVGCFQRGVRGYKFQPQLVADTKFLESSLVLMLLLFILGLLKRS
jgi:hypothetical protein